MHATRNADATQFLFNNGDTCWVNIYTVGQLEYNIVGVCYEYTC